MGGDGTIAPMRGSPTELYQYKNPPLPDSSNIDCCRCGQNVHNTEAYECNTCGCWYHPDCVTESEKSDYDSRHNK